MLKVCTECTAAYTHTLDQCPQCPGTEHVWDYQMPDGWHMADDDTRKTIVSQVRGNLPSDAPDIPTVVLERPKDNDSLEKWQAYAIALAPEEAKQIKEMKRPALIETFG